MIRYKVPGGAMIRSWKGKIAEAVFQGRTPKGFPADLYGATRRKLARIDAATTLEDTCGRRPETACMH